MTLWFRSTRVLDLVLAGLLSLAVGCGGASPADDRDDPGDDARPRDGSIDGVDDAGDAGDGSSSGDRRDGSDPGDAAEDAPTDAPADGSLDLPPDEPLPDVQMSLCPRSFVPASVLDSLGLADGSTGFDYTGDGQPDNRLGAAFAGFRGMINEGIQANIDSGELIVLTELRMLDDPTGQDDPMVLVVNYMGVDADDDPDNNLGGMGRFLIARGSVDEQCQPRTLLEADIADRLLEGSRTEPLVIAGPMGMLEVEQLRFRARLDPDVARTREGLQGGVIQACTLHRAPNPTCAMPGGCVGGATALDLIRNLGGASGQPDIDRMGTATGLTTFQGTPGGNTTSCSVATGTIPMTSTDPDCPCDPAYNDGYSFAMQFTGIRATIDGVE